MKKIMCGWGAAILIALAFPSIAQTSYQDVIYLKDGSILKGQIMEQVPGKAMKLLTPKGREYVFEMEEIESIKKEVLTSGGAEPKPVAAPVITSSPALTTTTGPAKTGKPVVIDKKARNDSLALWRTSGGRGFASAGSDMALAFDGAGTVVFFGELGAGYFLGKGFLWGATGEITVMNSDVTGLAGSFLRGYIKGKGFIQARGIYNFGSENFQVGGSLGYAVHLSKHLNLEPRFYYLRNLGDFGFNVFGLRISLAVYY